MLQMSQMSSDFPPFLCDIFVSQRTKTFSAWLSAARNPSSEVPGCNELIAGYSWIRVDRKRPFILGYDMSLFTNLTYGNESYESMIMFRACQRWSCSTQTPPDWPSWATLRLHPIARADLGSQGDMWRPHQKVEIWFFVLRPSLLEIMCETTNKIKTYRLHPSNILFYKIQDLFILAKFHEIPLIDQSFNNKYYKWFQIYNFHPPPHGGPPRSRWSVSFFGVLFGPPTCHITDTTTASRSWSVRPWEKERFPAGYVWSVFFVLVIYVLFFIYLLTNLLICSWNMCWIRTDWSKYVNIYIYIYMLV